jgi:amidase
MTETQKAQPGEIPDRGRSVPRMRGTLGAGWKRRDRQLGRSRMSLQCVHFAVVATALALAAAACTGDGGSTAANRAEVAATESSSTPHQVVEVGRRFPLEATIPELQDAMAAGRITSVELVDFYLARIAAYDSTGPNLNSIIAINRKARDEAAALDAERAASGSRGMLHGIPVVVKDNIDTSEMPTTAGSVALEGFRPDEDAFVVQRLREAGAVILGKTNLAEFASLWENVSSLGGQTLSPYDLSRDPGGSSGGTAVAVTADFAAAGLGTDTCGSIRLPTAYNNLYGLRPTQTTGGVVSRSGVIPLSFTLDTVGPMTRSVVDLAILLDVITGLDPADPTTRPVERSFTEAVDSNGLDGKRIGVIDAYLLGLDADVAKTLEASLDEMAANGAEVIRGITLDETGGDTAAWRAIGPLFEEMRFALHDYLAAHDDAPVRSLDEIVHRNLFLRAASNLPLWQRVTTLDTNRYRQSLEQRELIRDSIVALMDDKDLDALAYPTVPHPAPPIKEGTNHVNCAIASVSGSPAIVVPAGFTSDGLPVGLELLGRPFDEPTLIAIAAGYEAQTDHRMLPPTTPFLAAAEEDT